MTLRYKQDGPVNSERCCCNLLVLLSVSKIACFGKLSKHRVAVAFLDRYNAVHIAIN